MLCKKCGNEMLDTAKFCPNCGAKSEPAEEIKLDDVVESKDETAITDSLPEEAETVEEEPVVGAIIEETPVKEEPVQPEVPKASKYGKSKNLTKPLSTASYFGMFFLMALPIIRLIMLLVWSFSDNVNVNKKHFAHAVFIWVLVSLILTIITTVVLFIVLGSTFYEVFYFWQ